MLPLPPHVFTGIVSARGELPLHLAVRPFIADDSTLEQSPAVTRREELDAFLQGLWSGEGTGRHKNIGRFRHFHQKRMLH